jgi:hypothetical protein
MKKNIVTNTELDIENNAASWLRQMVLTLSVSSAILIFFEQKNIFKNSKMAQASLGLLVLTALIIGIMTSVDYLKRKEEHGKITFSFIDNWHLIVCISTVLSFMGILLVIMQHKISH